MKKNLKIKIYGKVQGVFFRKFVKEKAMELGLTGWVRNKNDGTVEIEIEGEEKKLKDFVKQCKKGSPSSEVERVENIFSNKTKDYSEFKISS